MLVILLILMINSLIKILNNENNYKLYFSQKQIYKITK